MVDPQTRAEWQEAVDLAKFWIVISDVELYGIVERRRVNVGRCKALLARGAKLGYRPRPPERVALELADLFG